MENMKDSAEELKHTISSVNELMEPIVQEIEGEYEPGWAEGGTPPGPDEPRRDSNRSQEIQDKANTRASGRAPGRPGEITTKPSIAKKSGLAARSN